jgi:hypothetical protein
VVLAVRETPVIRRVSWGADIGGVSGVLFGMVTSGWVEEDRQPQLCPETAGPGTALSAAAATPGRWACRTGGSPAPQVQPGPDGPEQDRAEAEGQEQRDHFRSGGSHGPIAHAKSTPTTRTKTSSGRIQLGIEPISMRKLGRIGAGGLGERHEPEGGPPPERGEPCFQPAFFWFRLGNGYRFIGRQGSGSSYG